MYLLLIVLKLEYAHDLPCPHYPFYFQIFHRTIEMQIENDNAHLEIESGIFI